MAPDTSCRAIAGPCERIGWPALRPSVGFRSGGGWCTAPAVRPSPRGPRRRGRGRARRSRAGRPGRRAPRRASKGASSTCPSMIPVASGAEGHLHPCAGLERQPAEHVDREIRVPREVEVARLTGSDGVLDDADARPGQRRAAARAPPPAAPWCGPPRRSPRPGPPRAAQTSQPRTCSSTADPAASSRSPAHQSTSVSHAEGDVAAHARSRTGASRQARSAASAR